MISSGVLSEYTKVDEWFFKESYVVFNEKEKELFKIVDGKDGAITYYVLTKFLTNQ